jgi:hypothetical protein
MKSEQEYVLDAVDDVRAEIETFRDVCVAAIATVEEAGKRELADRLRTSASRSLAEWYRAYSVTLVAASRHALGETSLAAVVASARELVRDIDRAVDSLRAELGLDEET